MIRTCRRKYGLRTGPGRIYTVESATPFYFILDVRLVFSSLSWLYPLSTLIDGERLPASFRAAPTPRLARRAARPGPGRG